MAQGTGRPASLKEKKSQHTHVEITEKTQLKAEFAKVRTRDSQSQTTNGGNVVKRDGKVPSGGNVSVRTRTDASSREQHGKANHASSNRHSDPPRKQHHHHSHIKKQGNGSAVDMGIKNMEVMDDDTMIETVEIIKRPGQTLGFYIREGNGMDRHEGVFISRIASGSIVEENGLLRVGDEILTVNSVTVTHMSLDDVVILMSIPKRLVLTIRTKRGCCGSKNASCPSLTTLPMEEEKPVVVLKKGRSSSTTAVEMTEKCPDEFILSSAEERSYYAKDTSGYMQKHEDRGKHSRIRGYHQQIAKGGGMYGDDSGDSGLSSEHSAYSQRAGEAISRTGALGGAGGSLLGHGGGDSRRLTGADEVDSVRHSLSQHEGLISGLSPQQEASRRELIKRSPKLSHRELAIAATSRIGPKIVGKKGPAGYTVLDYSSDSDTRMLHERVASENYANRYIQNQNVDLNNLRAYQEELERTQAHYEGYVNTRHKYSKNRDRSVSPAPECYNSDSELVFRNRGRMSPTPDREYLTNVLDGDYKANSAVPQMGAAESKEDMQHWLKKFDALAYELQQQQDDDPIYGIPARPPGGYGLPRPQPQHSLPQQQPPPPPPPPPQKSDTGTYTSGEYWSWLHNRSASLQAAQAQAKMDSVQSKRPHPRARVTRKLSADSLLDYRTYQMPEPTPDPHILTSVVQPVATGHRNSHSYTSLSSLAAGKPKQNIDSEVGDIPAPSVRTRGLQLTRKPLVIKAEEFRLYKPEVENKKVSLEKGLDGLLAMHICSGHGLKSSKTILRDLYCVVEVDNINKARTMIRTGAINFDWDELFDIDLENAREISFLIYSWDPNSRHRLCFSSSLMLLAFLHKGKVHKVALKLEPKGILYLEFLYKEPAVTLQRTPSIRKNALFGVDLETIIKREKSGYSVPILVKRCIDEVESRGLEIVGIYRLCGSAKRKAHLKEDFERNPRSVDLSPDKVSDINVVTGVLKDFLRELPEPLFTNALYQMLLDALSVRLPGDPDGSAKLMLSILECLPKPNQDTMALLLDHLKRVALKSDVNRMTTKNLAVCFGPVLLCPSPQSASDISIAMDFKRHIEVLNYLLEIWPENRDLLKVASARRASRSGSNSPVRASPSRASPSHASPQQASPQHTSQHQSSPQRHVSPQRSSPQHQTSPQRSLPQQHAGASSSFKIMPSSSSRSVDKQQHGLTSHHQHQQQQMRQQQVQQLRQQQIRQQHQLHQKSRSASTNGTHEDHISPC